jgi:hypothetical protein
MPIRISSRQGEVQGRSHINETNTKVVQTVTSELVQGCFCVLWPGKVEEDQLLDLPRRKKVNPSIEKVCPGKADESIRKEVMGPG